MSSSFAIGGLASGIDTNAIVRELMFAARAPVRRLEAAKSAEQRELDAWNDLGSRLTTLQEHLKGFTSGAALRSVTSSSSNDAIVRSSASAGAAPGTYGFRVASLAAAHQLASAGFASPTASPGEGTVVVSRGSAAVGIGDVDAGALTAGAYTIEVRAVAGGEATVVFDGVEQVVPASGGAVLTAGDGSTLVLGAGTELTTGTASLVVARTTASSTLAELRTQLNAAGSPVRAQLIDTGDGSPLPWRLVLTSTSTGTANALDVQADGLAALDGGLSQVRAASDSVLSLGEGGLTVTRSTNTIDDVFDGLTLELRAAAPDTDVEVAVAADVDSRVSAIKGVVDQLNAVLTRVATYTRSDPASGTRGALVGNFAARQLSAELRSAAGGVVPGGDLVLLAQIGITSTNAGTFAVDEAKLRAAVTSDPAGVERLLVGDGTGGGSGAFGALQGAAERLKGTGGLVTTASAANTATMSELDAAIRSHEVRLQQVEARYSRQFAALEAMIGQMRSQSAYLASALAQWQ